MSTHGPILSEDMIRALPSRVSRIAQGLLLGVGIVSTAVSIAGEYAHGSHYLQNWLIKNVTLLGGILHLILIVLILFPGRIRLQNDEVSDLTAKAVIRHLNRFFIRAWVGIWVCFGLFYTVYFFRTMEPERNHEVFMDVRAYHSVVRETLLMDLTNIGSTLFIFLCYCFLTPKFLRDYADNLLRAWKHGATHQQRAATERRANMWIHWWQFRLAVFLALVLALVDTWFRLHMLSFPDPTLVDKLLSLGLGLTSAFALAAFAGRMDSKFILNWQWVIPILFLYAGIQTYTNILYEDVAINKAVFIYSAFTMKCVLFIFVSNFFEKGRAVYYAVEVVKAKRDTL